MIDARSCAAIGIAVELDCGFSTDRTKKAVASGFGEQGRPHSGDSAESTDHNSANAPMGATLSCSIVFLRRKTT